MMLTRTQALVLFALALALGAGIAATVRTERADAQIAARQYSECFWATVWNHDGAAMANPNFRPRTVHVPRGWTPIGGAGGGQNIPVGVVLCR
jgi:hypothetical protein